MNKKNSYFLSKNTFKNICKNKTRKFLEEINKIVSYENNSVIVPEQDYKELLEIDKNLQNDPQYIESENKLKKTYPSLLDETTSFVKSLDIWAANGFEVVDLYEFTKRTDTCRSCEHWDAKALFNTGKCNVCGCATQAKLRLATEKCPLDKWLPTID